MKIDIYPHIMPVKYKEALCRKAASPRFKELIEAIPTLFDLDARFRILDKYSCVQVLTLGAPPVEAVAGPKEAAELAHIANNEMAGLVAEYPDRFVAAVAALPMNDMDAALQEADRAIMDLKFKGVQISSSINGKPLDSPEFFPLYEKMVGYDLPIWLHPGRGVKTPDYPGEKVSKYQIMCAYDFFGPEHILFGTDMPFDNELGSRVVRQTIASI